MAKRFAETKIWDDEWYQELPIIWKLLWKYLCDRCDEAGIWKKNFRLAEFQLGTKIVWSDSDKFLNKGKERIVINDNSWIIKGFVNFQYGEKVWTSTHGFHVKIREMLKKHPQNTLCDRVSDRVQEEEEVKEEVKEEVNNNTINNINIINDLNFVLGTTYKTNGHKINELIRARFNDGFTEEDFKTVHRKMLRAWGADSKMVKYLRPQTLYGTKFEAYLNMKETTTKLTETGIKAYIVGRSWLENTINK